MASFYLDHNVSADIAREPRVRGHNARTVRELGTDAACDDEHVPLATQQGWIIVTHNRKDFVLLHRAWHRWFAAYGVTPVPMHAGILVVRPNVWSASSAADALIAFVESGTPLANELHEWKPGRGWVRHSWA